MKAIMDKYSTIIMTYFKVLTKYKVDIIAKLVYLPVKVMLIFFLWYTIYQTNKSLDLQYIILYYILVILITQMYPYMRSAREIEQDIIEGTIASYMTRPIGYLKLKILNFIARIGIYFMMVGWIIVGIILIFQIPVVRMLLFLLMMIIGSILLFVMWTIIGLVSFWLEKNMGMLKCFRTIISFCSGSIIPFSLLNKNLVRIIDYLPFRVCLFEPIDILINPNYDFSMCGAQFLIEGIWLVIMISLMNGVWYLGCKQYNPNFN